MTLIQTDTGFGFVPYSFKSSRQTSMQDVKTHSTTQLFHLESRSPASRPYVETPGPEQLPCDTVPKMHGCISTGDHE